MDKLILTQSDLDFLIAWRDAHTELVRSVPRPFKAIRLIIKDEQSAEQCAYVAVHEDKTLTFRCSYRGRPVCKLVFEYLPDGKVRLVKNTSDMPKAHVETYLTVYSSAMAFIVYGAGTMKYDEPGLDEGDNTSEKAAPTGQTPKTHKSSGKKRSSSAIYLIRRSSDPNESAKTEKRAYHKSAGEFSVRGHFRHYKSGKIVWVSEFKKGSGKRLDKTYKIGSTSTA